MKKLCYEIFRKTSYHIGNVKDRGRHTKLASNWLRKGNNVIQGNLKAAQIVEYGTKEHQNQTSRTKGKFTSFFVDQQAFFVFRVDDASTFRFARYTGSMKDINRIPDFFVVGDCLH